jgi:hypothetical protein
MCSQAERSGAEASSQSKWRGRERRGEKRRGGEKRKK